MSEPAQGASAPAEVKHLNVRQAAFITLGVIVVLSIATLVRSARSTSA